MASKYPFAMFTYPDIPKKMDEYLVEASLDALNGHPASPPVSLICPISKQLMKEPVYTPDGFVYDRVSIEKALTRDQRDPQSRNKLLPSQLRPFPQLLPHIEVFTSRQALYLEEKARLIKRARELANTKPLQENPDLFLCPLNKKLIKNAVITATGKIYDRDSLKQFLQKTGDLDETRCQLTAKEVVPFVEFDAQIKVYEFYLSQQKKAEQISSPSHTSYSFFSILHNLFWRTEDHETTLKIY